MSFDTILYNSTPKKFAKRDKVWGSVTSLFKWRFRSRCRRGCLSSLVSSLLSTDELIARPPNPIFISIFKWKWSSQLNKQPRLRLKKNLKKDSGLTENRTMTFSMHPVKGQGSIPGLAWIFQVVFKQLRLFTNARIISTFLYLFVVQNKIHFIYFHSFIL